MASAGNLTKLKALFKQGSDNDGNELKNYEGKIYLKLASENRNRMIGKIVKTKKGNIVYHKSAMKEADHVMRKNDSWGLHWEIIDNLPDDAYVLIESDVRRYLLTVDEVKKSGTFLWFKTQGFERQFFVPRKLWGEKV